DVLKLLRDLKSENVDGLLVDLRGDGGGYLPEATALTGLFINHGPVVQLRDTAGRLEVLDDPEPAPAYDGPLAVLVDRLSASAAVPPVAALATEEDARAQRDPDYRWLLSDIAAIDSVRGQHSVSLNLKARREERARIDAERLTRENSRLVAKNMPPLKSVEELEKTKDKDEAADVVLEQATQVMADMVSGAHIQPQT